MSMMYRNSEGVTRDRIAAMYDVPLSMIAPVRRRRRPRRIVLLQWVVPVFAAEAAVLLVIIFFGRAEYRVPSLVALCAIVAWHVVYAVTAFVAARRRTRGIRDNVRAIRRGASFSFLSIDEMRSFGDRPPAPDPWAHVRERDN